MPGRVDRIMVKHVAPLIAGGMFDTMVNPGVYRGRRPSGLEDVARSQPDIAAAGAQAPRASSHARCARGRRSGGPGTHTTCMASGLCSRPHGQPRVTPAAGEPAGPGPDLDADQGSASRGEASKGERTRRSILDAAIVRFAREGYRSTSLSAVARDAGLSPSAIYPYFPNKEALFIAAVDEDAAGEIEDGMAGVGNED